MRRYALNHHAICPQYQAPEIIEKRHTQGIRRRMPCVLTCGLHPKSTVSFIMDMLFDLPLLCSWDAHHITSYNFYTRSSVRIREGVR